MTDVFQTISRLHRPLDFHRERHALIASNIANVDTPGFQPMELVRSDETVFGSSLPMRGTDPHHLAVGPDGSGQPYVALPDARTPVGRDGNSVSLEHETTRLAANDLRYDAITTMVARNLATLRYAANDATSG